jgi:hypothetical protein
MDLIAAVRGPRKISQLGNEKTSRCQIEERGDGREICQW